MTEETVAVVARDRLFRESLVGLLEHHRLAVDWQGSDVTPLLARGRSLRLVVLDLADGDVAAALRSLRDFDGDLGIVVLDEAFDQAAMSECFRNGADGYLVKDISGDALAQSLRLVMLGEKVFPTALARVLASPYSLSRPTTAGTGPDGGPLSARERQILGCLVSGDPNKVIAAQLGITEATVKVHLKTILRKINARNRTQAAIWAINSGVGKEAGVGRRSA